MNKTAALERLTKLESEAAELRKIIEQPEEVGLWEPDESLKNRTHFFINASGDVQETICTKSRPIFGLSHGNIFQTEAIAHKASELQRVHNHVMRACFQADPDAGEWSESRKIGIYRNGGRWNAHPMTGACNDPCVHTHEQGTEACRLLNAWQAKEDAK
jgi:hypothetical protein